MHLQLETPAAHYLKCSQTWPYQWVNKKHQVAMISNSLKSWFLWQITKLTAGKDLFGPAESHTHNAGRAARPVCVPSSHLMHKLCSSHRSLLFRKFLSVHPLWCCSTGQTHLPRNYPKILNFHKPYFPSQSTLWDGNSFVLTSKLIIWNPTILNKLHSF